MLCCVSRPGKDGELNAYFEPQLVGKSALPAHFAEALTKLYGEPKGSFVSCADGFVNFQDDGPRDGKVVVCAHGIGTKMAIYDGPIHDDLIKAGFRVINYSFYGHGWSYAKRDLRYDKEMFLAQARMLLDYLLKPEEAVHMWIGHSTGGLVGALAANSNAIGRRVDRLALISPAFYAEKPAVARLGDRIPTIMGALCRAIPALIADGYLENAEVAFAKENGKHLYTDVQKQAVEDIKLMFELHPQVNGAILGVMLGFLRADLLPLWREELKAAMGQTDGPRLCLVWGTLDTVVSFQKAPELLEQSGSRAELKEMVGLGHESPLEDPQTIARACVDFGNAP